MAYLARTRPQLILTLRSATPCPSSTQVVLATTSNCVATTDQYGNWGVWVSPGTYTFTITIPNGNSIGPYTVTLSGGGSGTNILPLNNTFTGTNNFVGGLTINSFAAVAASGFSTIGDCATIFSISPPIVTDGGTCGGAGGSPGGANNDVQVKNGSSFGSGVSIPANVGVVGNIAVKSNCTGTTLGGDAYIRYASRNGSDSNDGCSWGSAKATVDGALISLPAGASNTWGVGTVYFSDQTPANSSGTHGLWGLGITDSNYASPPAGWFKISGPIEVIGMAAFNGATGSTNLRLALGGSNSGTSAPCIQISGDANVMTFRNINCQGQGVGIRLGQDSSGTRTGSAGVSGKSFLNVGACQRYCRKWPRYRQRREYVLGDLPRHLRLRHRQCEHSHRERLSSDAVRRINCGKWLHADVS